jgi:glutathione synthase/RimK-type ligase-like ATP-grasp enzyme
MPPDDAEYAHTEWRSFHRNLEAAAADVVDSFWVNPPAAARAAENKLAQLIVARRLGIAFPDTVIGNDVAAVRRLARRCERIVFKTFRPHVWLDGGRGKPLATAAVLLDSAALPDAEVVSLCPGIYQRHVEKIADIRVTVAGNRKRAIAMRNRDGSAFLDWRVHSLQDDFLAEPFVLPAALDRQIDALMDALGLVFGCIDFVEDRGGELQFLEINQAGQFLFVEELLPECGMLRLVASFLAAGARDYAVSTDPHLTLAHCLAQTRIETPQRPA